MLVFRIQGASCNSPQELQPSVIENTNVSGSFCLSMLLYSLGHNVLLSVHLFYFKIYWLAFCCCCKIPLLVSYKFDLLMMWLAPVLILAPSPNKLMSQITRLVQALCLSSSHFWYGKKIWSTEQVIYVDFHHFMCPLLVLSSVPSSIEARELDTVTTHLKEDVGEVNLKRKYVWVRMKLWA